MAHARSQHPNAPLNPQGRRRMVALVLDHGWTIEATAERFQVDAKTVRKWRHRFVAEGDAGLFDRSSRPQPQRRLITVAKPVQLRRVAADDIDASLEHDLHEAGAEVARRLVSAVERAIINIARTPRSGSLRFAYELEIPDLRCWPLTRYPYLAPCVERTDRVDVWRVLHSRDIPATLAGTDNG